MKDKKNILEALRKQINQAKSVEEILSILGELNQLADQEKTDEKDAGVISEMAFHSLQDFTSNDPVKGKELILKYLAPICVQDSSSNQIRFNLDRTRKRLVEWIGQYSSPHFDDIRSAVLEALVRNLSEGNPSGACFTLAKIGFRNQNITDALWRIITAQDNKTGDLALSTLIFLDPVSEEREKAFDEIKRRMKYRLNQSLITALYRLADRRSLEPILNHWLFNKNLEKSSWNFELILSIFIEIANASINDTRLQDKIWKTLMKALKNHPQNIRPAAILSTRSYLASGCNSPHVIYDLLQLLQNESENTDPSLRGRYLIQTRLADCVYPRQQEAWQDALNDQLLHILHEDACRDTKCTGAGVTELILNKEMAWDTLLRLGCSDTLEWFEPAVANETDTFLRKEICNFLACFRLKTLPDSLITWITEEYNTEKETSSKKWIHRLAAIDVAWSAGSIQSFKSLLNCGLTLEGDLPQKTGDALANIAFKLIAEGNSEILQELLKTLASGKKQRHQIAAAGAIAALAKQKLLPREFIPSLEKCLTDLERAKIQHALLANAFGYLPKQNISTDIWQRLHELSKCKNEWVAAYALEALSRQNHLIDFEDLLISKLELKKVGLQWHIQEKAFLNNWTAYFTAWLHHFHPYEFTPAIIEILSNQQWSSAIQILEFWKNFPPKDLKVSEEIQNILIHRAIDKQKITYSEKEMFNYLTLFAPEKLIHIRWEDHWKHWFPEARQSLANTLGEMKYDKKDDKIRAILLLINLMDDGLYAVRRAAYQAYSKIQSPKAQYLWLKLALNADRSIEQRKRAAEMWGWLPDQKNLRKEHEKLYALLAYDPELAVRETVQRVKKERRNRMWANLYLQRVLEVRGSSNEEILQAWPYGKALARIGDENCFAELHKRMQTVHLPQNVRFWLTEISRELEKNWRKTIRKWPEPWAAYEGMVMQGHGTVIPSDGQELLVHYTIWHKPAADPSQYHDFRGMMTIPHTNISLTIKMPGQVVTLRLENGNTGKILITEAERNYFYFVNKGAFPTTT